MKKILSLILLTFIFCLSSCTQGSIPLPYLTGKSREEIKEILDELEISYYFRFADIICSETDYDCFVKYGNEHKANDYVSKDEQICVYTTPLKLTGNYASTVQMDFDYVGKSFNNDGVGEVRLNYSIDGDTADFIDVVTNQRIRLRFLGVNTPESTIEEDPWGKSASNYTNERLRNAKTIVLDADGNSFDVYGRYLGFVWVDGVLLNLELVDQGYTACGLSASHKYGEIFLNSYFEAKKTGRRFHGEIDPNYDYELRRFK